MEEVAEAVGGGGGHMPLSLALAVRETVAGHRRGALEAEEGVTPPFPMHPWVCPPPVSFILSAISLGWGPPTGGTPGGRGLGGSGVLSGRFGKRPTSSCRDEVQGAGSRPCVTDALEWVLGRGRDVIGVGEDGVSLSGQLLR